MEVINVIFSVARGFREQTVDMNVKAILGKILEIFEGQEPEKIGKKWWKF